MPKQDDDAQMRAQLAALNLERADVDENGQVKNKPYEAFRLKMAGVSYSQIAKRLGYPNERAARRAYEIYRDQAAVMLSDQEKREAIHLNLSRIETLMNQQWDAAMLGDATAAMFVLKCITEMNRLLNLYEVKEDNTVNKFVIINRESENYVEQLREIATKKEEPKAVTNGGHPDILE